MRAWLFLGLLVVALGTACGGDFGYPAAERAAVRWTGTPVARAMFTNLFVLAETRDFRVRCATALPLSDADREAGVTGSWCVTVGFLGRVRTFDGRPANWDEHTISVTVKAVKGGEPAASSWADCLCGP